MPSFPLSSPAPPLNVASISPAIAAALTDISPVEVILTPGMLKPGTRIRLYACGEYTTTSATPTCVLGFYMNQVLTAIGTTPAILAAGPANAAGASATAAPWQMWWNGRIISLSSPADATSGASAYGQGECKWSINAGGGTNAWTSIFPIPLSAALKAVAQTGTGLNTNSNQKIMVGSTWSTTTGVTSMTCDEFTCELLDA